jgi:drug/metabolite transporter (DMT)-like permease
MQPNAPASPSSDRSAWIAVGLTVLSGLLYVIGYTLSRSLVVNHGLSPLQVTFLRCVVVLAAGLVLIGVPRSDVTWRRLLRPPGAWTQRGAAALLVGSNVLAVLAFSLMSVTAASALGFTAPLILAVLGGLVLRERLSAERLLGTLLGFVGMLAIVKPGGGVSAIGIAAAFGGALSYAVYQVMIRGLRGAATTLDTILQVALVGTVLLSLPVIVDWHPVGLVAAGLVLAVTVVQTAALGSIAAALRRSEASRLAPWQFTALLWAMGLDAVLFQAVPTPIGLLGCALIVAGGVLAQRTRA